jgi:hypothetical protein
MKVRPSRAFPMFGFGLVISNQAPVTNNLLFEDFQRKGRTRASRQGQKDYDQKERISHS